VRVLLKLSGILLALYVIQPLRSGEVYAKSGLWGRTLTAIQPRQANSALKIRVANNVVARNIT